MGMRLPRIVIDHSGPQPSAIARRTDLLRPGELSRVLNYDRGPTPRADERTLRDDRGPVDRCVALGGDRWMVGRRRGHLTIWRLVTAETAARLGHPAWLWTKDWWFDPSIAEEAEGPVPTHQGVRGTIRYAAGLSDPRSTIGALAAVVAGLRAGTPVALVVSPSAAAHPASPARWFVLTLLAMLPAAMQGRLRIGVNEPEPDPRRFDLVTTTLDAPEGFQRVDAMTPPADLDDPIAYFVRTCLLRGDPEVLEAAARAAQVGRDPEEPDLLGDEARWAEGILERLRAPIPGVTAPTADQLARQPEEAVRGVVARLRAGAPVDPGLVDDLVRLTVRTGDLRPWAALAQRSPEERAGAVAALLDVGGSDLRPELVAVLAAVRPPGADPERWIASVGEWVRAGVGSEHLATAAIEELDELPPARILPLLAEISSTLAAAGFGREATEALVSAAAARTVQVGPGVTREDAREAARALVAAWVAIPAGRRAHDQLPALLDLLRRSPDAPGAIDALVRRLGDSRRELTAALASLPARDIERYAALLRVPPEDPAWIDAEARIGAGRTARERLVGFSRLGGGLVALEPVGRSLLPAALAESAFPDADLAEVALALAQLPGRSAIWPWIAVSAAAPGRFPAEVFEPAVVGVAVELPETAELVEAAYAAGHRLGASPAWSAGDLARWILLLLTSPDGGWAAPFGVALAQAIVQGIALQPDAIPRLVDITVSMSALGGSDPALQVFLEHILPNAWLVGFPRLYLDGVRRAGLPPDVRPLWDRVVRK